MITHRYADGSEGYEYEIGDRVVVDRTIYGGSFNIGPAGAEFCTVETIDKGPWLTATLGVRYSDERGPASCYPWMLRPHAETLAQRKEKEI
jgi:hypothetical protein